MDDTGCPRNDWTEWPRVFLRAVGGGSGATPIQQGCEGSRAPHRHAKIPAHVSAAHTLQDRFPEVSEVCCRPAALEEDSGPPRYRQSHGSNHGPHFKEKKKALEAGDEALSKGVDEGKDIMSILMKANMDATESDRLSDNEVLGQMS